MSPRATPNVRLAALLAETGWTGDRLARTVNAAGAEAGLRLSYQRSSVAHWLSGMRPRPPVPALVAEVFSRALDRPVPVEQTGLAGSAGSAGPAGPESAGDGAGDDPARTLWHPGKGLVEMLVALSEAVTGPDRRRLLTGGAYSLAALAVPRWSELGVLGRAGGAPAGGRVGTAEVLSAQGIVDVFADGDAALGGDYVLPALTRYLAVTVGPWLRADASPKVRRTLLATAAKLTYLAGFACFDANAHPTAQRYYTMSLRLSAEAGDPVAYAVALRALSVQASALGHRNTALELAESAVDAAGRHASAQGRAFLLGQLAAASAAVGDRRAAVKQLSAAHVQLSRATAPHHIGGCHPAALAHVESVVFGFGGDRAAAISALQASLRHRPAGERRSRAITTARLAELHLDAGHLEAACASWSAFLDDYPRLRSGRADRALAVLSARTRPHAGNPHAAAIRRKALALKREPRRAAPAGAAG